MIKPISPVELNSIARIMDTIIKTLIPDGTPEIKAARNIGASEKSARKKGNIGNIARFPKNTSTNEATDNIALYTIMDTLFFNVKKPPPPRQNIHFVWVEIHP